MFSYKQRLTYSREQLRLGIVGFVRKKLYQKRPGRVKPRALHGREPSFSSLISGVDDRCARPTQAGGARVVDTSDRDQVESVRNGKGKLMNTGAAP